MGTAAQLRKAPSPYSERNTLLPRRAVTSSQNRAYRPAVSVRPTAVLEIAEHQAVGVGDHHPGHPQAAPQQLHRPGGAPRP